MPEGKGFNVVRHLNPQEPAFQGSAGCLSRERSTCQLHRVQPGKFFSLEAFLKLEVLYLTRDLMILV